MDNICLFKHFQRTNPSHIFVVDFSGILPFLYPVPFIATPKCQILVKRKTSSPVKSQGKWLPEDIFSNAQVNWKNTYQLPFLCTTETKLWVFQFKFLQRRVATNDFLLKIGKKETDSCSFCAGSPETLTHLFWQCRLTQTFWKNV